MARFEVLLGPAGIPHSAKGGDTASGVRRVAEIGLGAMEIEFVRGVHMGKEAAEEVGNAAKQCKVSLSVHAPYFINLCSDDRKVLSASKRRILESCERAHDMGARIVAFHPGFYMGLEKEEAYSRVLSACEDMRKSVPKGVLLGLETAGKHSSFGSVEEIVSICKSVKVCAPVVDFAHLYARGNGSIDYGGVLRAFAKLRLGMLHSHFSNIEFWDKGERQPLPLDHSPPFLPLAKEIARMKTNITLICESPLLEEDALRMKEDLERIGYEFSQARA
jgi:deoxyribonuclease IV